MRVVLRALGVVDERGEDDDAEHEEEDEKAQLVRARLERLYEDLEAAQEYTRRRRREVGTTNRSPRPRAMRILRPGEWRVSLNSRMIRIILIIARTHARRVSE